MQSELLQRLGAMRRLAHIQTDMLERRPNEGPDQFIVIRHQHRRSVIRFFHVRFSCRSLAVPSIDDKADMVILSAMQHPSTGPSAVFSRNACRSLSASQVPQGEGTRLTCDGQLIPLFSTEVLVLL